MDPGRLKFKVDIEKPSDALTDAGERESTWTKVVTLWAAIEPLQGRELELARQKYADVTHKVTTYVPDDSIKPTMRIKFGSRYFNITEVINVDERGDELQMKCKEVVG